MMKNKDKENNAKDKEMERKQAVSFSKQPRLSLICHRFMTDV